MNHTTVTDLQNAQQLNFSRGRYNILDCGIRTGKTYWAVNNLQQFTRDGRLNRILFLTDTTALKTSIIEQYGDKCYAVDDLWKQESRMWSSENIDKIGIMCYQALGANMMRGNTAFLDYIDVICWDECDSIFDFAVNAFTKARKTDFARKDCTNEEILTAIQTFSTKQEYMPLVLLGGWEKIINEQRILCIGLSATPERTRQYYQSLTHAAYIGKLRTTYRASEDIFFKNVLDHIDNLVPMPGIAYWCYSPSVTHNQAIVEKANRRGFNAIEIHSKTNDKKMNAEQLRVVDCIDTLHIVPPEYDFVVVTRAFERGIDIIDSRFKHLIVDSYYHTDREQAGRQVFPYQRHVKILSEAVPEEYLNKWMTLEECRGLAELMHIPEVTSTFNSSRVMTWNKLQQTLPQFGYTVEKQRKRLNGAYATMYRITGEWHDVEISAEGDFMQLAEAAINARESD